MAIRTWVLISLVLPLTMALADDAEMPHFSTPPTKYVNRHEISLISQESVFMSDELILGDITNNQLKFWFWIVGTNGHQCSTSGIARNSNGAYVFTEETTQWAWVNDHFVDVPATCSISIKLGSPEVTLEDQGDFCRKRFCGTRASIGKTVFIEQK